MRKLIREMIRKSFNELLKESSADNLPVDFHLEKRNSGDNDPLGHSHIWLYFDIEKIKEQLEEFQKRWLDNNPGSSDDDFYSNFYNFYDYLEQVRKMENNAERDAFLDPDFDYYTPPASYDEPDEIKIDELIYDLLNTNSTDVKRLTAADALGLLLV